MCLCSFLLSFCLVPLVFVLFFYPLCLLVFPLLFYSMCIFVVLYIWSPSPFSFSLSSLLCGLSLAFIKPKNAMRSCLDNDIHRGRKRDHRQLRHDRWSAVVSVESVAWKKWIVYFETAPFSPKMDILNLPLNFWHLAIGTLWKPFFFNFTPGSIASEPLDLMPFIKQSLVSNLINSILNWLFNF
jgi:hypothetical protein